MCGSRYSKVWCPADKTGEFVRTADDHRGMEIYPTHQKEWLVTIRITGITPYGKGDTV